MYIGHNITNADIKLERQGQEYFLMQTQKKGQYLYNGRGVRHSCERFGSSGVYLCQLLCVLSVGLCTEENVCAKALQSVKLVLVAFVDGVVCLLQTRAEGHLVFVYRQSRCWEGYRRGGRHCYWRHVGLSEKRSRVATG